MSFYCTSTGPIGCLNCEVLLYSCNGTNGTVFNICICFISSSVPHAAVSFRLVVAVVVVSVVVVVDYSVGHPGKIRMHSTTRTFFEKMQKTNLS